MYRTRAVHMNATWQSNILIDIVAADIYLCNWDPTRPMARVFGHDGHETRHLELNFEI